MLVLDDPRQPELQCSSPGHRSPRMELLPITQCRARGLWADGRVLGLSPFVYERGGHNRM